MLQIVLSLIPLIRRYVLQHNVQIINFALDLSTNNNGCKNSIINYLYKVTE